MKYNIIFLIILLFSNQNIKCYVNDILLNSIGYWEIKQSDDQNFQILDQSMNKNNAISENELPFGYTIDKDGYLNNALDFSIPNTDYISIPANSDLQNFGQNWSISFFVNAPPTGNQSGVLISHELINSIRFNRDYQTSSLIFNICSSFLKIGEVFDNTWKHIVVTVEKGIYLNIVIDGYYVVKGKIIPECSPQSQENICIGANCISGSLRFDGKVDKIGFFNKALNKQEINNLSSYPNCPSFCDSCSEINGNLNCDSCKGDRQQIGNICDCIEPGKYDDMFSQQCQNLVVYDFPLDDPLVLYYPMDFEHNDSNLFDESGQKNLAECQYNFQVQESCYFDADVYGNQQMAMAFDYYTYYDMSLFIYPDAATKIGNKDFTIMLQFKTYDYYHSYQQYIMCGDGGDTISISQTSYQDNYSYYLPNIDVYLGGQYIASFNNVLDQNWHFIAITRFDQTKVGIMIDGNYQEYDMIEVDLDIQDGLSLGNCLVNNYYYPFRGILDEVRVYQKRLVESEMYLIQSYPQCPFYCNDCIPQQGRFICITCRGDRIIGEDGYTCVCPEGYVDDYQGFGEFCLVKNDFLAYYNMDNNFIDLSPVQAQNGYVDVNGGTFIAATDRLGNPNSSMDFSTSLTQVQIQKHYLMNFKKNDFTISMWLKGPSSGNDSGIVLLDNSSNLQISRDYITQDLSIQIQQQRFLQRDFFTDEWKYLTLIRYDVEFMDVMINGKKTQTLFIGNIQITSNNNYMAIGAYDNPQQGQSGIFDGQIDELRIYDKKISLESLQVIMSYPECPSFCPDCTITTSDQYISTCNSCKGDRILDIDTNLCVCPQGFYDDYQSENCLQKEIVYNPLILYYSFDVGVNDISQNIQHSGLNNAVLQNSEKTTDMHNVKNRAYKFIPESLNSKIMIDNINIFDFKLQDITIIFWLKGPIISEYPWGNIIGNDIVDGLSILRYSNTQDMRIAISGVYVDVPNVFTGDWVFVTIQRQLTGISVTINDQLVIDNHYVGLINLNISKQVCIGRSCNQELPFDGAIDELMIYEVFLEQVQIQEIKNYQCIFPCLECDYLQQGQQCLSCKGDRIFNNGQCQCPDGFYDDFINEQCQQCPYGCLTCTGPQNCDLCVNSVDPEQTFRIAENICACPSIGYYDSFPYCQQCNNIRCLTCQEFQTCDTCVGSTQDKREQRQQSKTCQCPQGYFDDIENESQIDCISCESKTKHCTLCEIIGGTCIECKGDLVYMDGICQCPKGTYPQDLTNPNETLCEACPSEKAECSGGYEINLKSGYWRQNTQTVNILQCYNNEENCIGGNGNQLCKEGHIGALCEACDIENRLNKGSYANSSEFECSPCSEVSNNGLKIFGLIMLQMVSLYLAVIGTITAMQDQIQFNCIKLLFNTGQPLPDEQGVLIKILQNYLYIVSAILTFQIEIPSEMAKYAQNTSTPAKSMAYSFDCTLTEMQSSMPNLYFRIIWQILVGIFQLLFVYLIGFIMIKLKKTKITFVSLFWTALIYQYIALQPAILTMILEATACRDIGGVSYILSNTSIECFDDQYNRYTYTLLFPLLFVWVLVIPFTLFVTIRNQATKKQNYSVQPIEQNNNENSVLELQHKPNPLEKPFVLQKYGYLYLEYKQSVYWWEFVKIFQRILIATVLSFYYIDIYVKGILVFMTVVIYGVLQYKYHPYKIHSQNQMDQLSILVTGISLIIGLFLYQNQYTYWVLIAGLFLACMNIYLIIIILRRILKAKARTLILKITEQKEKIEHQEIYLQNLKEQEDLKKNIQEYENKIKQEQGEKRVSLIQDRRRSTRKLTLNKEKISQLDLLHLEELNNNKKKKKSVDNSKNKGLILSIITTIDKLQVKYLGYANQQTLQEVKQCKFMLRKYIGMYIDGINSGLIEPLYKNTCQYQKIQVKKQNKQDNYIFTTQEMLDGLVTESQYLELEEKLNNYKKKVQIEELFIQNQLRGKIVTLLQKNKFNNKYAVCEKALTSNNNNNSNQNYINLQKIQQEEENNNKFDVKFGNRPRKQSQQPLRDRSNTMKTDLSDSSCSSQENIDQNKKTNRKSSRISIIKDQLQNENQEDKQKINQLQTIESQQDEIKGNDNSNNNDNQQGQQSQNIDQDLIELKDSQIQQNNNKNININSKIEQNNFMSKSNNSENSGKQINLDQNENGLINLNDDCINEDSKQENQQIDYMMASDSSKPMIVDDKPSSQFNNRRRQSTITRKKNFTINIQDSDKLTFANSPVMNKEDINFKLDNNDNQSSKDEEEEQSLNSQQYEINEQQQQQITEFIYNNSEIKEIKEFLISFQLLDTENTGKVTKKQMVQIMKKLGINISKGQIDKIYDQFDFKEQEVDFVSFSSRLLKQKYYQKPKDLIREIYSRFDMNSNGCLSYDDIQLLIETILTKKYSVSVYKEIVHQEDREGNGGLTLHEFLHFVL